MINIHQRVNLYLPPKDKGFLSSLSTFRIRKFDVKLVLVSKTGTS